MLPRGQQTLVGWAFMAAGDKRSALIERFSARVDSYAELNAPLLRQAAQPLLDQLDLTGARRILDLGAGTGSILGWLAARAPQARCVGVDLSAAMLSRARRDTQAPVAAMDVARLALADGVADVAVSTFVLRFVPDPLVALREQRRILADGGVAGVAVWGAAEDSPHEALLDRILDENGADPFVSRVVLTDDTLHDPAKLRAAMVTAGFAEPHTWGGELVRPFTAQSFVDFAQRGLERFRQRLAGLDDQTRASVLTTAVEQLSEAGLATGEDRSPVVYGLAGV
ncbi:MAG: methyltransferase domain-containing protein [Mycobacteriales bacterium]